MYFRCKAFLTALLCLILTACSSVDDGPGFGVPDLLSQLSAADLSEKNPQSNTSRVEFSSSGDDYARSEQYPGNDQQVGVLSRFKGLSKGSSGYELNFNEAGLAELAQVILRDTLEIPYAFDPRVQGRVTLSTGGPVSRDELLSIFETVLEMNRAALVLDGKVYRIVPDTASKLPSGASVDYVSERRRVGPGYGISIVPLKYVSTETMMRMLGSFAGNPHVLRASVHKNLLIIRGSGKERQSMLEIAMMFDVDWMKGQSAGIFVVKNASPTELIGELQQVFQSKGQGSGLVRFEPVNRLNAILVLTQKSHLLDKVSQWIDRLDRNGVEGDNYYVYRVENAKAKDLAEILNATFSSGGSQLRSAEEDEVAPNRSAAQFSSPVFAEPTMAETGSGSANTAHEGTGLTTASGSTSSTISSGSRSRISASSDEVRITPDEINNKLLIKAPGRIYRKILGVLYRIDQPPLQVLINATLAEVTLNDNLQYGVQFFLQRKDGDGGTMGFSNGSQIEIEPTAPGLNFIVGSTNTTPKVILDALATETNVRVVSSPSVVVLHNQAATLQVGDEVPVATRRVSSATDSQAPLINEIEFRNTGVILQVTPRINSNGLVTMEIQQEISSVTSAATVGDGGDLTPTISQRRIASTIAVQNGQMVVLGGLISEQSNVDKNRVPIIRNIPYLGDIVGSTDSGKIRKELIVFLQPKIIKEPKDAAQIAEELRSRMESLAPRPNLGAALFK